MTGSVEIT